MSGSKKIGALALLTLVFAVGALGGIAGTLYIIKESQRGGPWSADRLHDIYKIHVDRMVERLDESLDLTEAQIPLVRAEVEKIAQEMEQIHVAMRPQFDALMRKRNDAIEAFLTPEQKEVFSEHRRYYRERSRQRSEEEAARR